jgi:hypothetical protein
MARTICGWTGKLPRKCRLTAEDILIAAAKADARRDDLAALAAEIDARSLPTPTGRVHRGVRRASKASPPLFPGSRDS